MRKLLLFLLIFITVSNIFSQAHLQLPLSSAYENTLTNRTFQSYIYGESSLIDPPGAVLGMSGFFDYQTNGNNLNNIMIWGDSVVVCWMWSDSLDPQGLTSRKAYYNFSSNMGVNWDTVRSLTTGIRSGYPTLNQIIYNSSRSIALTGRVIFASPPSRGAAWVETLFSLGPTTQSVTPDQGRDMFSSKINDSTLACAYTSNDTLIFRRFNCRSGLFTPPVVIAVPPEQVNINTRFHIASNSSGNNISIIWSPALESISYDFFIRESTNGGNTFAPMDTIYKKQTIINSDTTSPYYNFDIIYKKATNLKYTAFSTLFGNGVYSRRSSKILFWSPAINNGNVTIIADKNNIPILMNESQYNQIQRLQAGVLPVSHPSIAFSEDGSRIYCVYSVAQVQRLNIYNYNDIYLSYSDNGINWSTPINLTNTPDWDELYPSISETGNTRSTINIVYQYTKGPGSQSFNDNAPAYRTWQIYKKFTDIPTEVTSSNEVPSQFALHHNYPNPFNPSTAIKFDLMKPSYVSLKVYDIMGRLVSTIINNEQFNAGTNEVVFNGEALSSGIYYYTLTAGDFTDTKKMLLVK